MANSSYQTNTMSMAHCPVYMKTGKYSRVPGDSILGLYGADFQRFQQGNWVTSPECSYCEKHSIANAYMGPYHLYGYPVQYPTYGTVYKGLEAYYRQHPYENNKLIPCQKKQSIN